MKGIDFFRVVSLNPSKYMGKEIKGENATYTVKRPKYNESRNFDIFTTPIENVVDDTRNNVFYTVSTSLQFISDEIECNDEIPENTINDGIQLVKDTLLNGKDLAGRVFVTKDKDIYLVVWHEDLEQYTVVDIQYKMNVFSGSFQGIYDFLFSPIRNYEVIKSIKREWWNNGWQNQELMI